MKYYRKKIKEYNRQAEETVSGVGMEDTISAVKRSIAKKSDRRMSYVEFVFQQSRFIQKRWWFFQMVFLIVLSVFLGEESDPYLPRLLGMGAPLFVTLMLPEIWKNRRCYSMEIEGGSYYSLRRIYSARMITFALVDLLLLTIFWGISGLRFEMFIMNFILPLNICCSICFRMLYAKKASMELTVLAFAVWTTVWMMILTNDLLYERLVLPMWGGYLAISLAYLSYCVYKLQTVEEGMICG